MSAASASTLSTLPKANKKRTWSQAKGKKEITDKEKETKNMHSTFNLWQATQGVPKEERKYNQETKSVNCWGATAKDDIHFARTLDKDQKPCYSIGFDQVQEKVNIKNGNVLVVPALVAMYASTAACGKKFNATSKHSYLVTLAYGFPTDKSLLENVPDLPERQSKSFHFWNVTMRDAFMDYVMSTPDVFGKLKVIVKNDIDTSKQNDEIALDTLKTELQENTQLTPKEKAAMLEAAMADIKKKYTPEARLKMERSELMKKLHYPLKRVTLMDGDNPATRPDGSTIVYHTLSMKATAVFKNDDDEPNEAVPQEVLDEIASNPENEQAKIIKTLYETGNHVKRLVVVDPITKKSVDNGWFKPRFYAGANVVTVVKPCIFEDSVAVCGMSLFVNKIMLIKDGEKRTYDPQNEGEEYVRAQLAQIAKEEKEAEEAKEAEKVRAAKDAERAALRAVPLTASQVGIIATLKELGVSCEESLIFDGFDGAMKKSDFDEALALLFKRGDIVKDAVTQTITLVPV
jgi:hypothetical protein